MRKKMGNLYFHIFYPGLNPQSTVGEYERRDMPAIYVARDGNRPPNYWGLVFKCST